VNAIPPACTGALVIALLRVVAGSSDVCRLRLRLLSDARAKFFSRRQRMNEISHQNENSFDGGRETILGGVSCQYIEQWTIHH